MKYASLVFVGLLVVPVGQARAAGTETDYPIRPVPFTAVQVGPGFWAPRMETNRAVTVPYCFERCEETGRISNFVAAAQRNPEGFQGIYFNDSDVYKIVEGASYTLALRPDAELDAYLDELIAKFAAAQEEDGYLYTAKTSGSKGPFGGCDLPSPKKMRRNFGCGASTERRVRELVSVKWTSFCDIEGDK
ncbi:MAG: glycoside hydrolase family 127 protein, partial [Planctomycetes bacterium]|nr:glycoside hydrolase family 127 protein [Planctomycetota bacterium]